MGLCAKPTEISSAQATEKLFSMNSCTGVSSNGCARLIFIPVLLNSVRNGASAGSFNKLTSMSGIADQFTGEVCVRRDRKTGERGRGRLLPAMILKVSSDPTGRLQTI